MRLCVTIRLPRGHRPPASPTWPPRSFPSRKPDLGRCAVSGRQKRDGGGERATTLSLSLTCHRPLRSGPEVAAIIATDNAWRHFQAHPPGTPLHSPARPLSRSRPPPQMALSTLMVAAIVASTAAATELPVVFDATAVPGLAGESLTVSLFPKETHESRLFPDVGCVSPVAVHLYSTLLARAMHHTNDWHSPFALGRSGAPLHCSSGSHSPLTSRPGGWSWSLHSAACAGGDAEGGTAHDLISRRPRVPSSPFTAPAACRHAGPRAVDQPAGTSHCRL